MVPAFNVRFDHVNGLTDTVGAATVVVDVGGEDLIDPGEAWAEEPKTPATTTDIAIAPDSARLLLINDDDTAH